MRAAHRESCSIKSSSAFSGLPFLVIGCGFSGAVIAERIANDLGEKVVVVDRHPVPGGLSFSEIDAPSGIEIHRYGSHIFHTSDREVWRYVNRFCGFNQYCHRVFAALNGELYSLPVNLLTVNRFFHRNLRPQDVKSFLAGMAGDGGQSGRTSFEKEAIGKIGPELFQAFFEGYSRKQWGEYYELLDEKIFARLNVRYSLNSNYFTDFYQGIPVDGYGELFRNMLRNPKITLMQNVDFDEIRSLLPAECRVICTGTPEMLFHEKFGRLKWRSVRFEFSRHPVPDWQGTSVVNYPDAGVPYTRIHEFKHFHPENPAVMAYPETVICHEYPCPASSADEPMYPVGDAESRRLMRLYQDEADRAGNLFLAGRLGSYRYLNMDQAIRQSLDLYSEIKRRHTASVK